MDAVRKPCRLTPLSLTLLGLALMLLPRPAWCVTISGGVYSQPIALGVNVQGFDMTLPRGANIGWVRITLPWRDINPSPGSFNFSTPEALVTAARAQGLRVLAILSTAPVWAGSNAHGTQAPANVAFWEEFVRRTAQQFAGRIDAYEIWNEPNLSDSGDGVGWSGNIWSAPRYVDYLRAAAIQIRTYAAGTLVVGPATSSQPNAQTVEVFKQLEQVTFPDGPASSFLDVVSFHANAGDNESVSTINSRIVSQLSTLTNRNPKNVFKPIWLTEFGWKSNRVGEGSQRDRIKGIIDWIAGADSFHDNFKWTNVFIYKDLDSPTESSGIYRGDKSAKYIVTNFLRSLPFPGKEPNGLNIPFSVGCSGRTCTFTSSRPDDGDAIFNWDFGDGTEGSGRTVTHTFARKGHFFVANGVFHYVDDPLGQVFFEALGSDTQMAVIQN